MKHIKWILSVILSVLTLIPPHTYAVNAAAPVEVRGGYEVTGTDSVGRMLADLMEDEEAERAEAERTGYSVSGLEVSGGTATVNYTTDRAAWIIVSVYDDQTQQFVTLASTDVEAGTGTASVSFPDALPEYFIASAFLLDPDTLAPLSAKTTTTLYTEAMQELSAATTDDFEPELVLDLDGDKTNNFLIFDESVKRLDDTAENVRYEDGVCTITDADAAAKALREGDVFSCDLGGGQTLIVKAASVRVDGDTVTIVDDPDADLEDAFSVIKIDSEAYEGDAELSSADYEGKKSASVAIGKDIEGKNKEGTKSVKGKVSGRLEVKGTLKLYHKGNYTHFEFELRTAAVFTLSVEGELEKTVPLGEPVLFAPVPCVLFEITPSFVIKASAKLSGEFEFSMSMGRSYETGSGWTTIGDDPKVTKAEVELEGTVFIGFSLEPEINVLYCDGKIIKGGLINASLTTEAGIEVKANTTLRNGVADETISHDCDKCVDGDISFKAEMSGELKSSLKVLRVKGKLLDDSNKLGDFYFSIRGDGKGGFGWGKCPHIRSVDKDVYAILYKDGEMVFQHGKTPEAGRDVLATYEVDLLKKHSISRISHQMDTPWYTRRDRITSIRFADTIQPVNTANWFYGLGKVTEIKDIKNLETSQATDMEGMFNACRSLTTLDLSSFDTSNVTTMLAMFSGCDSLTMLDLSDFDTSNVTNMSYMFRNCSNLTKLNLSGLDTSNVTDIVGMFWGCSSLTSLNLSGFDTSKVTGMNYMFNGCIGLTTLNLSGFDTSNVTTMWSMFSGCSSLTTLDLSGFDTSNVEEMGHMFSGCSSLKTLDLSCFDTYHRCGMGSMFTDCSGLMTIDVSELFTCYYENTTMFSGCTSLVGGAGTVYDKKRTGSKYARVDGGPSAPGYFTLKTA